MHSIDCHILTLPQDNPAWAAELRRDLDGEPVNQHWLPGVPGELGLARLAGFRLGSAPYVSWADPDDRVMRGTFPALLAALEAHPRAPFAWAGEQRVDADLMPIGQPAVYHEGHSPRRHRNFFGYVHGVVLMRRAALEPALGVLRQCGYGAEAVLLAHLARLGTEQPAECLPVHVPIVGRMWRQHPGAYHLAMSDTDRARAQRLVGVKPQYLHAPRPSAASAPCATCGPPGRR